MTSDLYQVTSNIYATDAGGGWTASPIAPELDDEKTASEKKADEKKTDDKKDADKDDAKAPSKDSDEKSAADKATAPPKPVKVDLERIGNRIVALPLPASDYIALDTGLKGSVYILERPQSEQRFAERGATLSRWTPEDRKTEKLAEGVLGFEISADGKKMLLAIRKDSPSEEGPGEGGPPTVGDRAGRCAGEAGRGGSELQRLEGARGAARRSGRRCTTRCGGLSALTSTIRISTARIQWSNEKRLEPYVASIASRADLNYIFQEMLRAFSVGHLRGNGEAEFRRCTRCLAGCSARTTRSKTIATAWPRFIRAESSIREIKAPLAQPGLNVKAGDCILAINGEELTADGGHSAAAGGDGGTGDRRCGWEFPTGRTRATSR